ncbi:hypothetical protein ACI09O_000640 [Cronobacter muytjensii]
MKHAYWLAAALLALTACNKQDTWENSDYLIKTISVDYDNKFQNGTGAEGHPEFQAAITEEIRGLKEKFYFHLNKDTLTWYQDTRPHTEKIADRRVQINGIWHTLTRDATSDIVRVVSDNTGMCGLYRCTVTMELTPASAEPARLARLKAQFQQTEQRRLAQTQRQKAQAEEALRHPPAGFLVSLNNDAELTLPDAMIQSLQRWESGIYSRRIGKLSIDWQNEHDEIYSFTNPAQTLHGELIIAPGAQGDIEFDRWLALQESVIYASSRGAIYYNAQGLPEAFYYHYNAAAKRYVIGIANSESFADILTTYSVLRTMDPEYRMQNVIKMDDLALPAAALEERMGITASDLFDCARSRLLILDTINTLLAEAERGEKATRNVHRVPAQLSGGSHEDYAKMVIHRGTLRDVAAKTQKDYPGGRWLNETYLYPQNAQFDGAYSFLLEKDGLVYEFYVDNSEYTQAERMLYLTVLRTIDAAGIHSLPASKRANLFAPQKP